MSTEDMSTVVLPPGEFYFGGGAVRVSTLLGSCVAITMWHPRRRIGGMCHYLLPRRGSNQCLSKGHFADEALGLFLEAIKASCTRPAEYDVKLFGGGNMFQSLGLNGGPINVSRSNIDMGSRLLCDHGFSVKARDLGGAYHRRVILELWSGDVWVQRGVSLYGAAES